MALQPGYFGLSGIELAEDSIDLGEGVTLSKTYAHLMAPFIMAFKPAEAGRPHPGPWKAASGGSYFDVTTQLVVPMKDALTSPPPLKTARLIVFLIRLWNTPEVVISSLSSHSFADLPNVPDREARIVPYEVRERHFALKSSDGPITHEAMQWVADQWVGALELSDRSNEFRFAMDALDAGQFIPNSALVLVSLWSALEGLFAPSTAELKFRVSALLASYLEPAGPSRLALQKEAGRLYDRRSKAAHGKPDHSNEDLLATFSLVRRVLIKIIERNHVPSKDELELLLLGGGHLMSVSLCGAKPIAKLYL